MYANTYAHIHAHAAAILISKHNLMPIDYFITSLIATMAHYPLQDFGPQASSPSQDFGPQADWHHQCADRVGANGFPLEQVLPPDPTAVEIQAVLELWAVPRDAYPKAGKVDVNYSLKKKGHKQCIHVHLRTQAFVTTPKHRQHSYFSFFNVMSMSLAQCKMCIMAFARMSCMKGTTIALPLLHGVKPRCWQGGWMKLLQWTGTTISIPPESVRSFPFLQCWKNSFSSIGLQ